MCMFWLKDTALEELNRKGYTTLLDMDGDETQVDLVVHDCYGGVYPQIFNVFGCNDVITLKSVEIDEEGNAHCETLDGFVFWICRYTTSNPNICRRWER